MNELSTNFKLFRARSKENRLSPISETSEFRGKDQFHSTNNEKFWKSEINFEEINGRVRI